MDTLLAFPHVLFPTTGCVLLQVEMVVLLCWVVFPERITSSLAMSCWVWENIQMEDWCIFYFPPSRSAQRWNSICPITSLLVPFFLLIEQANHYPLGWPGQNSFCSCGTNISSERKYIECICYTSITCSTRLASIIMFPYLTVKPSSSSSCSQHTQLLD